MRSSACRGRAIASRFDAWGTLQTRRRRASCCDGSVVAVGATWEVASVGASMGGVARLLAMLMMLMLLVLVLMP